MMRSPAKQKCCHSQERWLNGLNGGHQSLSEIESTWYTAGANIAETLLPLSCCRLFLSFLSSSCSKNAHELMVSSTELRDLVINLCWLNRGLVTCDGQADHLVGGHLVSTLSGTVSCLSVEHGMLQQAKLLCSVCWWVLPGEGLGQQLSMHALPASIAT